MTLALPTTNVTFPSGATEGTATVLAVQPLADGGTGLVVGTTPFHPLDHSWPDQPGDSGTVRIGGAEYAVVDCVTGGIGPEGEFAIGADIPVRRGDESWSWLAVHVLEPGADAAGLVGGEAELLVDRSRRAALSASHTGCHLLALALNEALADRWRKEVRADGLGSPDFDATAMESSRMDEHASTDRYRIGKSLRKKGFDPEGLREALPEVTEKVNARLATWVAADAGVRIDAPGPELTARRQWVCELPEGTVSIFCGGTHLHRLSELTSLTTVLSLSEDGTELVAVTTPKRK
jgi:alanyl-tRNA synthetase